MDKTHCDSCWVTKLWIYFNNFFLCASFFFTYMNVTSNCCPSNAGVLISSHFPSLPLPHMHRISANICFILVAVGNLILMTEPPGSSSFWLVLGFWSRVSLQNANVLHMSSADLHCMTGKFLDKYTVSLLLQVSYCDMGGPGYLNIKINHKSDRVRNKFYNIVLYHLTCDFNISNMSSRLADSLLPVMHGCAQACLEASVVVVLLTRVLCCHYYSREGWHFVLSAILCPQASLMRSVT